MMFCPRCGKPVEDDDMFCPSCGYKMDTPAEETVQAAAPAPTPIHAPTAVPQAAPASTQAPAAAPQSAAPTPIPAPVQPQGLPQYPGAAPMQPARPKKKLSKGALIGIIGGSVALVAALGVLLYFTVFAPTSYDVSPYLVCYGFDGYEGEGYCDGFYFDGYEMLDHTQFKKPEQYYQLEEVLQTVYVTASPEDGLSNGDTVTATVGYDEALAKKLRIRLTGLTTEYTVSGLAKKVELSDLTAGVLETIISRGKNETADWIDHYDSFSVDFEEAFFCDAAEEESSDNDDQIAMVFKATYSYEDWWEDETVTETRYYVVYTYDIYNVDELDSVSVYVDEYYDTESEAVNSITKYDGYGYTITKLDI